MAHQLVQQRPDHITIASGGTLTVGAGATLTVSGYTTSAVTTLAVGGGYGSSGLSVDESGNLSMDGTLTVDGGAVNPGIVLVGVGNLGSEGRTASGTHVADAGTFAFAADQKSMRISVAGTVYQIPLWADA